MPHRVPEYKPKHNFENISERKPEDISNRILKNMPDKITKNILDRIPEDLLIATHINIMMEIIRNTIIIFI
jgi:hypothetical protein